MSASWIRKIPRNISLKRKQRAKYSSLMLWSFGQVRATMLHPGMRTSSIFNTQHVATLRNRVAKRTQHVAPNNVAICCVDMLRSFGRGLQILGQRCCNMLRWNVAMVWPGLANTGPTILRWNVATVWPGLANTGPTIFRWNVAMVWPGLANTGPTMLPWFGRGLTSPL